ncbi:MAG: hypothetical protein HHJ10_12815 [Cellulomonas sp.]|nr:hypothetical protein [Cellulomonas sp.]NMM31883.1 hypothetical protein [Cellulomonas sp.]
MGAAALILSVGALILTTALGHYDGLINGQVLALAVVWGFANSLVVRRN